MPPKQKQTIIKKPAGNGNISITIENNLKNTNTIPPVVKKRRKRRNKAPTEEVNLPPPPPLKDVSYIKPPSDRFTVWRDNLDDSFNTTIPQGQAQQMGLLRSLATPAITNQPPPRPTVPTGQISTQTEAYPLYRAPRAIYDPLGISDDESSSILAPSSPASVRSSLVSSILSAPSRAPSASRTSSSSASSIPSSSASSLSFLSPSLLAPSASSLSSDFMRQMNQLTIGLGRGNAYDNLQYDPYGNEAIEDRFSDRSSLASFYSDQYEPQARQRSQAPSPASRQRSPTPLQPDRQRSPTTPPPARDRSQTPPPAQQQADIPFAVDIYEELARDNPNISSVEEAAEILAADKDATATDVQNLYKGKQSIFITAKSMGKKHGRSGKEMQGPYKKMPDYKNSWLVGRAERDAKNFMTMDADYADEELYRNSFAKIKNSISQGTPKRQTRAKTRNEDIEAGSVEF